MSKKRFSKKGFARLERNFQMVEKLVPATSYEVRQLQVRLTELEVHRADVMKEHKEKKSLVKSNDFYNQRMALVDRDISQLNEKLKEARKDRYEVGVYFKRCFYLMYGKPKLSDVKK